jgi:two-component system, response regulator RegA
MRGGEKLLLVDDDAVFGDVLARALQRRGCDVSFARSAQQALLLARAQAPHFAVVDLRIGEDSGLPLVTQLRALSASMRILVLTGFASITTAVEAIKLGADHYLSKPAHADEVMAALLRNERTGASTPISAAPISVARLEWEHIQKVLHEHDGNISATARALNMYRRTLQRKLAKRPVREKQYTG